eukprot:11199792-Lingulodinium_polyedra.AAC.1
MAVAAFSVRPTPPQRGRQGGVGIRAVAGKPWYGTPFPIPPRGRGGRDWNPQNCRKRGRGRAE